MSERRALGKQSGRVVITEGRQGTAVIRILHEDLNRDAVLTKREAMALAESLLDIVDKN